MGASDFDERNNRLDISRYAPPRYRVPTGATAMRAARERLSRGASAHDSNVAAAQYVPPDEPIQVQTSQTGSRWSTIPLAASGRLAVAVGLAAVLAIGSVTLLKLPAGHTAAVPAAQPRDTARPARALDLPRPVRTVTVRQDPAPAGDAQVSAAAPQPAPLSAQPASLAERIGATGRIPAQPRVTPALAVTAPLKMWAMFPGGASAGEDDTATGAAKAGEQQDASDNTPAQTAGNRKPKAVKQARRRHRARPRRTRSAAGKPRPARQATAEAVQPVKKLPLQAAIDAMFANRNSSGDGGSAGVAPATTGAAFR